MTNVHTVTSVDYYKHIKESNNSVTMKVVYNTKRRQYMEWICIEHTGGARQIAMDWWQKRTATPMPQTVDRAIELAKANVLLEPVCIFVDETEKYPKIVQHAF